MCPLYPYHPPNHMLLFIHVHSMDWMPSTVLQWVATSALFITWHLQWSPCSTVQTTMDTPCCIMQLRKAILKLYSVLLKSSSWTHLLATRYSMSIRSVHIFHVWSVCHGLYAGSAMVWYRVTGAEKWNVVEFTFVWRGDAKVLVGHTWYSQSSVSLELIAANTTFQCDCN